MQTTIETKSLKSAFAHVNRFVDRTPTLPVLGHVKVRAVNGHVAITGTDLDCFIEASIPAVNGAVGEVLIPATRLADASKSKQPVVTLETHEKGCFITQGAVKASTMTLPVDDFPPTADRPWKHTFTIPASKLHYLMTQVALAISTDECRYVLNGIFFEFKDGTMRTVATDGRRLCTQGVELDHHLTANKSGNWPDFILPSASVKRLLPILKESAKFKQTVVVSQAKWQTERIAVVCGKQVTKKDDHHEVRFLMTTDGAVFDITSKLIDGNYPNYRQVIPLEVKEEITVDRLTFLDALKQAEKVTTANQESVKLSFKDNVLTVSTKNPTNGEIAIPVPVNYKGKDMTAAYNPNYLIDWLSAITAPEVVLGMIDELSPMKAWIGGEDHTFVLMPMRLN